MRDLLERLLARKSKRICGYIIIGVGDPDPPPAKPLFLAFALDFSGHSAGMEGDPGETQARPPNMLIDDLLIKRPLTWDDR